MTKKEKLLKDLIKSNKARRQVLAERAGFTKWEIYKDYLEGKDILAKSDVKVKTEKVSKKKAKEDVILDTVVDDTGVSDVTDMVIAFDTTGSMGSYIGDVKKHVTSLIPTLFEKIPNLRISIVAFGDYCDMSGVNNFGKAYQVIDLTNDEAKLIDFVKNAKNTHGGDGDEFYELVLHRIRTETNWRSGSNKSILLIADALPHSIGYSYKNFVIDNQIDWKEEARLLNDLGCKVDTLSINGGIYSTKFYQPLADMTNGICLPFKSANKTSQMMEAYSYKRSGKKDEFEAFYSKTVASGDAELTGVVKSLATL